MLTRRGANVRGIGGGLVYRTPALVIPKQPKGESDDGFTIDPENETLPSGPSEPKERD